MELRVFSGRIANSRLTGLRANPIFLVRETDYESSALNRTVKL